MSEITLPEIPKLDLKYVEVAPLQNHIEALSGQLLDLHQKLCSLPAVLAELESWAEENGYEPLDSGKMYGAEEFTRRVKELYDGQDLPESYAKAEFDRIKNEYTNRYFGYKEKQAELQSGPAYIEHLYLLLDYYLDVREKIS